LKKAILRQKPPVKVFPFDDARQMVDPLFDERYFHLPHILLEKTGIGRIQ